MLESDPHGPKVLRTRGGVILKLFRRKRLLTSALWDPYALRFARNAEGLAARGIASVTVRAVWHCPARARHVVAYDYLPGATLRQLASSRGLGTEDWQALGVFVARLHACGVYFRSLHLGNIVALDDGGFGLIDVADLHLHGRALGERLRVRNFRPLLADTEVRHRSGASAACAAYLEAACAGLPPRRRRRFAARIREAFTIAGIHVG